MTTAIRRGAIRCGAAAALFGASTPIAVRIAADTTAPILAGLLYIGAALAVAPLVRRGDVDRRQLRAAGRPLGIAVLAGGFLGPLLLAAGLARVPAATASLLLNGELVATAVLAAVLFNEHIGPRVATGTVLVTGGGVLLAVDGSPQLRWGAVLISAACLCWALDNCVTAALDEVGPRTITLVKGVVAGSTNLLLGLALGGSLPDGGTVALALVAGGLGYGTSITLWVAGARDLGAARGQLVFSTAPFVGVAISWLILSEPVRGIEVTALGLGAAGVTLVVGSAHSHRHDHVPLEHTHRHEHDEHHDHHRCGDDVGEPHEHRHRHAPLAHAHPHVPDLHHHHGHG